MRTGMADLAGENIPAIYTFDQFEKLIIGIEELTDDILINGIDFRCDTQIKNWLIETIKEMNEQERRQFCLFVTGTVQPGLETAGTWITVNDAYSIDRNSLPEAHTCFNTLDIPNYRSKEVLKQKLLLAITESNRITEI